MAKFPCNLTARYYGPCPICSESMDVDVMLTDCKLSSVDIKASNLVSLLSFNENITIIETCVCGYHRIRMVKIDKENKNG